MCGTNLLKLWWRVRVKGAAKHTLNRSQCEPSCFLKASPVLKSHNLNPDKQHTTRFVRYLKAKMAWGQQVEQYLAWANPIKVPFTRRHPREDEAPKSWLLCKRLTSIAERQLSADRNGLYRNGFSSLLHRLWVIDFRTSCRPSSDDSYSIRKCNACFSWHAAVVLAYEINVFYRFQETQPSHLCTP